MYKVSQSNLFFVILKGVLPMLDGCQDPKDERPIPYSGLIAHRVYRGRLVIDEE